MEFSSIPPTSEPALVQTKLEEMLSSSKTGVLFPDPADLLYWLVSQDRKIIRGERSSNERLRPLSHSLLRRQPDLLC